MWLMMTILYCAVLKNHSLLGQTAGYNHNDYMIPKSGIIFFFSFNKHLLPRWRVVGERRIGSLRLGDANFYI